MKDFLILITRRYPYEGIFLFGIPLKCFPGPNSLNQRRAKIFMPRKCAQSIPRLEKRKPLSLDSRFPAQIRILVHFRFNTSTLLSLNQGQTSMFLFLLRKDSTQPSKTPLFMERPNFRQDKTHTNEEERLEDELELVEE